MKAFNGDISIFEHVRKLVKSHSIKSIVETGTGLGDTTVALASFGLPVWTIDINQLSKIPGVTTIRGDSGKVLEYLETPHPVLYYLDAHGPNCPLLEELTCIDEDAVIVIHDFRVPGRDDLGYDTWDIGVLEWALIEDSIEATYGINGYRKSYNYYSESGNRGVIFVEPL